MLFDFCFYIISPLQHHKVFIMKKLLLTISLLLLLVLIFSFANVDKEQRKFNLLKTYMLNTNIIQNKPLSITFFNCPQTSCSVYAFNYETSVDYVALARYQFHSEIYLMHQYRDYISYINTDDGFKLENLVAT